MNNNENIKILSDILFNKYQKVALTAKETACILGRSEDLLKKDREQAIGIPYIRLNQKLKAKPLYSITSIAKALVENEKRVS